MKLKARIIPIETGFAHVVTINHRDAIRYDLHPRDRVSVETVGERQRRRCIAVVDVITTDASVKSGHVGVLVETVRELGLRDGTVVDLHPAPKPESVRIIKKKMEGGHLTDAELDRVVKDIVEGSLTEVELTYFVSAVSVRGLDVEETVALTKAVARNGARFTPGTRIVADKHCIGGVPGNRTTMIVVPILAAFGLTVPKTSSRAITSPAGTADTMETLCDVSLPLDQMRRVVQQTGACIVWGGALGLAPADDKIIRIEKPMSIDAEGLMLSSVMAKKYSVGATHVVIDIPHGHGVKVTNRIRAEELKHRFLIVGQLLGMKITVVLTDGRQPIGRGIGPTLEALDILKVLKNEEDAPLDLKEKSLLLASELLEFTGSVRAGAGYEVARDILESGSAWKKMEEIIDAQGRNGPLRLGRYRLVIPAERSGTVRSIDNKAISKLARMAGAPITKGAGLYLHRKCGERVKRGERLYTAYADSAEKIRHVRLFHEQLKPYAIR